MPNWQPNWQDVHWDYAAAQGAVSALRRAADLVDQRADERARAALQAIEQWRGRYRNEFDERLDGTIGTEFQRRVWAITRAIPRGQTRTYSQIARQAGSPGAARAVGQSMARNPWPIGVPCHRVLGSDGSLTGFGGGRDMKRRMLEMEGARLELPGLGPRV